MLQERIKNNLEYFRGMEMKDGITVIKVEYKDRWGAYNSKDDSIKVAKSETVPNEWYYYSKTDLVDIDKIFDLIEETVEMNASVIIKIELLTEKIAELKLLFSKTPLVQIQTLKFVIDTDAKEPPKKRKYTKRIKVAVENNEEEETIVKNDE